MKSFLFLSLLFSSSSFADPIVYGLMSAPMCIRCENQVAIACVIDENGVVEVETRVDGVISKETTQIRPRSLANLKYLVEKMNANPSKTESSSCDAGGVSVGTLQGEKSSLVIGYEDCGKRVAQPNRFAKSLGKLVSKACGMQQAFEF